MNIVITPTKLAGTIAAIPSKSYAHRIQIAAALADKPTLIHCAQLSADMRATIGALTALGAEIQVVGGVIHVTPIKAQTNPIVPCGESGTTARLLLPVAAALTGHATITGEGSLLTRPFDTLCETMSQNGCAFDSQTLPITVQGRLRAGDYALPGNISSQYISGLLFALPLVGAGSARPSRISLTTPLESSGYVSMTLEVLRTFGITIEQTSDGYLIPSGQTYRSPGELRVEGDWSNAAFWLAAGAEVTGLGPNSLQKDRLFSAVKDNAEIDAGEIPDLVPILAVYAAGKRATTRITNIRRLRLKESDRVATVTAMLRALGAKADADDNALTIHGTGRLTGGTVDGAGDHRIVMAAAIASCICERQVVIEGAEAAQKSYPNFFADFNTLGGKAHVV
ncbi:MAG: 3-phosphoshikimate 1-carboxyvinyltransferase [Clostridiales bacterium]|nr:3-phosphoshikimate 1-carboxyvinyltransferase [Clostridiales bacterium]